MTLSLFGTDRSWENLRDDRPILSGRHPLHLYHGHLGARAFLKNGSSSCYDPAFQAGYPKTPVFDSSSRPAELFLLLAGGDYRPDVYKIGLATGSMLVPLVLVIASRGAGLNRRAVLLATILGLLVWWGHPCQLALQDGNLDLLLGCLATLTLSGLLIRYDRKPGMRALTGIVMTGFLSWLFQPLLQVLLLPLFLIYYLSVGARHRVVWSILLLAGLAASIGANYMWLRDWIGYWWLRVPLTPGELLPHRTMSTLWNAPLWGEAIDRALALAMVGLGTLGGILLNKRGDRPAARLLGLGALLMILLGVGGILNDELGKFNTSTLLVPGLLFAVPLAAHSLEMTWRLLHTATGRTWLATSLMVGCLAAVSLLVEVRDEVARGCTTVEPLRLGLTVAEQAIIDKVQQHTTTGARILWESTPRSTTVTGWTTLLPLLTGRSFVGGLDVGSGIEHMADDLTRQYLAGRLLTQTSDRELEDYCRRYNIGWVVCWTPSSIERFSHWNLAHKTEILGSNGEGALFTIKREHSFILKGKARWLGAELNRIRLAEVVPEDGVVVLSLHYQDGLLALPSRVKVDRDCKAEALQDIHFILLRMDAPVAHLTLSWSR
jgi:hypothetical protein